MKKTSRITIAHIITGVCILLAGVLLYFIISNSGWGISSTNTADGVNSDNASALGSRAGGEGTRLEYEIKNEGTGFNRETTLYTENGITSVTFSGKIIVEGTAEISVISNEDGAVIYSETYTDIDTKSIEFDVNGLNPYSYYTLKFTSNDATKGHLILTTNQSLVEHPEPPQRPERSSIK